MGAYANARLGSWDVVIQEALGFQSSQKECSVTFEGPHTQRRICIVRAWQDPENGDYEAGFSVIAWPGRCCLLTSCGSETFRSVTVCCSSTPQWIRRRSTAKRRGTRSANVGSLEEQLVRISELQVMWRMSWIALPTGLVAGMPLACPLFEACSLQVARVDNMVAAEKRKPQSSGVEALRCSQSSVTLALL